MSREALNILRNSIEKFYGNYHSFCWWNSEVVSNIQLEGKKVLDIGCGDGIRSCYLAIKYQPTELVAIDDYMGEGSDIKNEQLFRKLISQLELSNVESLKSNINDLILEKDTYDVILCFQVVHHIFRNKNSIFKDKKLYKNCLKFFRKICSSLKENGCIVLEEISKNSLFRHLKLHHKQIEWKTKRSHREWFYILKEAGFSSLDVRYYVPYNLRKFRVLFRNPFFNFFLGSKYFIYGFKK